MKKKWANNLVLLGLLVLTAALFLVMRNLAENAQAENTAAKTVAAMEATAVSVKPVPRKKTPMEQPLLPVMEMPETTINGQNYIGTLVIPALERKLGVISQWSTQRLQISPCRYTGSVYSDDLVIAAHNYQAHFGRLKELQPGDSVVFTDVDGNTVRYQVAILETLMPEDVEEMTGGAWDLTLFTCTAGGTYRVTVRCDRAE